MKLKRTVDYDNFLVDRSKEKLFLGEYGGFMRWDSVYDEYLEKLSNTQLSNYWLPHEINCSMEKRTFHELPEEHQDLIKLTLNFQNEMDSVQTRCLDADLTPFITSPTLEEAVRIQAFFEYIHAKSYSHIIREVFPNSTEIFDEGCVNPKIKYRTKEEIDCYTNLKTYEGEELKWEILKLLVRIQLLEGVKFYVSFLTTLMINKVNDNKINNIAKIIRLISNDENIHCLLFSYVIRRLRTDKTQEFSHLFDARFEAMVREESLKVFEDELDWARYLLSIGSIKGMDIDSIEGFLKYYIDERVTKFKSKPIFGDTPTKPNELVKEFKVLNSINSNQMLQESSPLGYTKGDMKFDTERFTKIEDFEKALEKM